MWEDKHATCYCKVFTSVDFLNRSTGVDNICSRDLDVDFGFFNKSSFEADLSLEEFKLTCFGTFLAVWHCELISCCKSCKSDLSWFCFYLKSLEQLLWFTSFFTLGPRAETVTVFELFRGSKLEIAERFRCKRSLDFSSFPAWLVLSLNNFPKVESSLVGENKVMPVGPAT